VRRRAVVVTAVLVVLGVPSSAALAAVSPASSKASCVATITSYEASQLPPGAAGKEISGLGTSEPGLVGGIASYLARAHAGSIEACFEAEG
jgi:hypothetical protein